MKKTLPIIILAAILIMITAYSATALTIEPINNQEIHAGQEFSYDVITKNDTDDELNPTTLTYEFIEAPDEMTITEGEIKWLPLLKNHGEHNVEINVSNSTHFDVESFTIQVLYNDFNIQFTTEDAPDHAEANQQYTFELNAEEETYSDAIEAFKFTLEESPSGMSIENDEIRWTPTNDQLGEHTITVSTLPEDAPSDFEKTESTFEINVTIPSLTIERVEIRADSRRLETISRSNYLSSSTPYTIDREATLGDEIELRISVRNNLPSGTENEMRDVEIELYSFDLIEADGLNAFISRLRAERTEDQTMTFLLDARDLHPNDSPFDLEIQVMGETRDGNLYSDIWDLDLRVESKSYDLLMTDITLSPTEICPNERVRLTYDLRNIGTRDLSNLGVKYYVSGMGIDEWDRNFNLDYDDTRRMTKFLTIPENTIPGEYVLEMTAYPRLTTTSDSKTQAIVFKINDCAVEEEEEEEEEETVVVTPPEETTVPGTPVSEREGTPSTSIFDREGTIYVVLLTALVVLLLVGVILLLVKVLR